MRRSSACGARDPTTSGWSAETRAAGRGFRTMSAAISAGARGAGPPPRGAAFFKIWGAAAGDFWVVGEGGTLWHHGAGGWDDHSAEVGTRDALTTVHGCGADEVYAVGGMGIYVWRGAEWAPAAGVTPPAGVDCVACAPDEVLAVGNGGLKLRYDRAAGVWQDETLAEPFYTDFHGALVAGPGRLYAVGGNYNSPAAGGRVGIA